ncbi:MAG: formate dehydrogenase subunit alpha [Thermoanaerobacteraceae bacterium]|nr:formate dehydrogenase subunit alpha [Thermoanaerobacteraceae bacterium]
MKITIDGQVLEINEGTTIKEACESIGVEIPNLCFDEDLKNEGACRLCVVEVEKAKNLLPSCVTMVTDGMVVHTESEKVLNARRTVLELLLANHPNDCMTCDKTGRCRLQDYFYRYDIKKSGFEGERREIPIDDSHPFIIRDLNKCILCGKCIRICDELETSAINYIVRGFYTKVGTFDDDGLKYSSCVSCGNCLDVCPTAALMPKSAQGKGRPWELTSVDTTCPYCGVGCTLRVHLNKNKDIAYVDSPKTSVNQGYLCIKGRFGLDFVKSPDRLKKPLIRKNGDFVEVSWDEALSFITDRLKTIKDKYGPDSIGGLASAKCTNEENYIFQKFMRTAIGTNNVDHCARLCHAPSVAGLGAAFGSGAMTNSIEEIEYADCIMAIGTNTTETHPVISIRVKKALKRHGAKLIVIDPRKTEMAEMADIWLRPVPGTNVALLNGIMNAIIEEGLAKHAFIGERTEGFDEFKESVKKYTPEVVSKITGVSPEDIRRAALVYAKAEKASILYTMGVTQHITGTDGVMSIANLAMLTGNVGRPSTGVNPLRGQNNVQGACDMGALPDVYSGYQKVTDEAARSKFERAWGVKLSERPGQTVTEMINAAYEGKIKALYIMGENPVLSEADAGHVEEALKNLDLLVVQDIFMSETAELADVVLPAASFAEKDGTFTNTERRVQRVRRFLDTPAEVKADWQIINDLSMLMGYPMNYSSPMDIMEEIRSLTPSYAGITYDRLEKGGLQWPCPSLEHPGTKYLHDGKFTRGKGKFNPIEYREAAEPTDREYPYILTTGRMLYHFHTGTMTRRVDGLNKIAPSGYLEISYEDAGNVGISDGDNLRVTSRRGSVVLRAKVTERVMPGVVYMNFHFKEAAANKLTIAAVDPVSKIPQYKECAVKLEKI